MYWIVGKSGQLAQALQKLCEYNKLPYVATSRNEVDITKSKEIEKFLYKKQPQYVINTAAFTNVDLAEKKEKEAFALNASAVQNLSLACHKYQAKFIHISTDYVFDGNTESPYKESDSCNPINVYGMTKYYGEKFALENPDACVIRTSWVYGIGEMHFVAKMCKLLYEKPIIEVVMDQFSVPTFVGDLAEAIFALADQTGVVHFANNGVASRVDWIDAIINSINSYENMVCKEVHPVPASTFNSSALRPSFSALNTEKYSAIVGRSPRHWTEALHHYLTGELC